jgi:hypothetical protein
MAIPIDINTAIQQATQLQDGYSRSIKQTKAVDYMVLMNQTETLQGSAEFMGNAYKNISIQSKGAISALELAFETVSALLISLKEAKAKAEAEAADAADA